MFRAFQTYLSATNGTGNIKIGPNITNMEWDIYQISVRCNNAHPACQAFIYHNGFFLCASPQGWLDTATGPPNIIVRPGDELTVQWTNGMPLDSAYVGVWYNENPTGSTVTP